MARILRIGVISDTHGVVHPRVPELFARMDRILHAGDVGGAHVLRELESLAPLTYVDGNNDDATGEDIRRFDIEGLRVLLTHILPRPHKPAPRVLDSLKMKSADIVIFGHSHLPHHEVVGGVTYFNPASSGPRRFNYPVSIGMIEKRGDEWKAMHVALDERSVDALEKYMNQMSK
ncbi:MAG TPA: metallophosphoesterase family protein [Thermoanaerobaculia bacterium]|nr:metallophosphoesterase family protein [Thermoanaerobaculia bacterium]